MPNLDKNELPHWADPSDYDRFADDERTPERVDASHIHHLDRCEHYIAGSEVGWLCGRFPMFTNLATARASDGMTRRADLVTVEKHGDHLEIQLRSREGGRLVVGREYRYEKAEAFRDSVAAFIGSWFAEWIADGDGEDRDEGHPERHDGNLQLLDPLPEESNR